MRALREYRLLSPGDRLCVCISGGKDSMLLAKLIQILQRHSEVPFEARYAVMDPGYAPDIRRQVEETAERLGIPCEVFESDVFEAAYREEPEHPCFLCARMRRGCLYGKAAELGCNKIVLGHHFNDVIETTVMAMLYGGQMQGMLPRLRAKNFPGMELIRPMYAVHEEDILAWRDAHGLSFIRCACRFVERQEEEGASGRRQVKELLRALKEKNPNVERNVFGSIHTVQLDTLPGWKYRGERHSFLDDFGDG